MKKQNNNLNTLSVKELFELYRDKPVVYGEYFGKIIHVAYYSNLDNVPYAEIQSILDPEDTDIIPLSKVVLVINVA